MFKSTIGYITQSGNVLALDILARAYPREDIPLFYPFEDLSILCHHGRECKGLSGGCPPYAPYFEKIKPSHPLFYVIMMRMDIAWAIKYAGGNEYFRFSYADRLTAAYMARITKVMADELRAFRLVVGGCNSCAMGKDCVVLNGEVCAHPDLRTYSVEATGVDCSELHAMIFGVRLPYWYYDGALPRYMVRYGGLFATGVDDIEMELLKVIKGDKSYVPVAPVQPQFRLVEKTAPAHVTDAGMVYQGYEMLEDGSYATGDNTLG